MKTIGSVVGVLFFISGCVSDNPANPVSLSQNAQTVIQAYKPALAVRGISCMLCHAQVHSSILTDFGYGDPQFFAGLKPGTIYGESSTKSDSKPFTLPWYGNYYGTFQLADQLNGTLVVPKVTLTDPAFLASLPAGHSSGITLMELMNLDLGGSYYGASPYSGAGAISDRITPPNGNPKVAEIDRIYIGAPTESELLGLTKTLSNVPVGWEAIGEASSVAGLTVQAGAGGSYVTSLEGTLSCRGDIVIKGTLFLNDVTIDTDAGGNGCRLMVTQSVFIQGRIQFTSLNGAQNLQISSARAILMGFDPTTLGRRLSSWYPDAQPLTRGAGTNTQKNAAILAEASVIGAANLHDSTDAANCPTSMVTYEGNNGGGSHTTLTQCSIHYQRLLLNAPNIQSRYIGRFSGITIAEIALFAPGALDFEYDPVFDSVPIFPKIAPVLDGSCTDPISCFGGIIGI